VLLYPPRRFAPQHFCGTGRGGQPRRFLAGQDEAIPTHIICEQLKDFVAASLHFVPLAMTPREYSNAKVLIF